MPIKVSHRACPLGYITWNCNDHILFATKYQGIRTPENTNAVKAHKG